LGVAAIHSLNCKKNSDLDRCKPVHEEKEEEKKKLYACRGEGSAVGLGLCPGGILVRISDE
jgi:hypothetical protein